MMNLEEKWQISLNMNARIDSKVNWFMRKQDISVRGVIYDIFVNFIKTLEYSYILPQV